MMELLELTDLHSQGLLRRKSANSVSSMSTEEVAKTFPSRAAPTLVVRGWGWAWCEVGD